MRLPEVNQEVCDAIRVALKRSHNQKKVGEAFKFSQGLISQIKRSGFDYRQFRKNQIEVLTKLNGSSSIPKTKGIREKVDEALYWLFDF